MGSSRAGLTSKIHVLVDGRELPIELHLSEGQGSDCKEAGSLLDFVPEGSPIRADKTSDNDATSDMVEARAGTPPTSRPRPIVRGASLSAR